MADYVGALNPNGEKENPKLPTSASVDPSLDIGPGLRHVITMDPKYPGGESTLTCSGNDGSPKCIHIGVDNSSVTINDHVAEANIMVLV